MLLKTHYLILRKIPYQESSLVVSGLSPDYGRLDFLLKGARSSSAKKFPYAGLFRELQVEFRENPSGAGLLYMKTHEPLSNFDAIADYPKNYILLCEWVQFLLKHTRPMLEVRPSYLALITALKRLTQPGSGEFQLSAAKLVFLQESGFVPDPPENDPQRASALENILNYAVQPDQPEPEFTPEYRTRLIQWIRDLCKYAESF